MRRFKHSIIPSVLFNSFSSFAIDSLDRSSSAEPASAFVEVLPIVAASSLAVTLDAFRAISIFNDASIARSLFGEDAL